MKLEIEPNLFLRGENGKHHSLVQGLWELPISGVILCMCWAIIVPRDVNADEHHS